MSYTYLSEGQVDDEPMFNKFFKGEEHLKMPQKQVGSLHEGYVITGRHSINPKVRRLALREGSLAIMSTKKSTIVKEYFLNDICDVRMNSNRSFQITVRTEKGSRMGRGTPKLMVKRKIFETPGIKSNRQWVEILREHVKLSYNSNNTVDPFSLNHLSLSSGDLPFYDDKYILENESSHEDKSDDDDNDKDNKKKLSKSCNNYNRPRSTSEPNVNEVAIKSDETKPCASNSNSTKTRRKNSPKKDDEEYEHVLSKSNSTNIKRNSNIENDSREKSRAKARQRSKTFSGRNEGQTPFSSSLTTNGNEDTNQKPYTPRIEALHHHQQQHQQHQQNLLSMSAGRNNGNNNNIVPHRSINLSQSTPNLPKFISSTESSLFFPINPFSGGPNFDNTNRPSSSFSMNGSTTNDTNSTMFIFEKQRQQIEEEMKRQQQHHHHQQQRDTIVLSTLNNINNSHADTHHELGIVSGSGTKTLPTSREDVARQIEDARQTAEQELARAASLKGANAVLGVVYSTSIHQWGVTVTAFGTSCHILSHNIKQHP